MSKIAPLLLFVSGLLCHTDGQTQAPPPAKQIRLAQRPPESAGAAPATRQSTALSAAAGVGREPVRQLPSLATIDRDGRAADLQAASRTGHWLLLYRRPDCPSCDKLMEALAQTKDSIFQRGTAFTVVVAGSAADFLAKTHARFPLWSEAAWAADPQGDAFRRLKLTGAPVLLAMNGNEIAFRIAGTLGDPATVQTLVTTWLSSSPSTGTAAATSASTKTATTTP